MEREGREGERWGGVGMVSQARPLLFVITDRCMLIMEVTEEQTACDTRIARCATCVHVHVNLSPPPLACHQLGLVPHLMSCCSAS